MSTYINTPAGSGTDNTKCTISFWLKQTHNQGSTSPYLFSGGDGPNNNFWIRLQSDGRLYLRNRTSGGNDCVKTTNLRLRDFSAWYHLCFELDSTQSTAADRNKIWINGVLQTSFDSNTNMTQNNLWHCYGSTVSHIGKRVNDGSSGTLGQFNMSHFHYIDGTAYDASYFGSTDSTTGEWKINTSPNVTYGTRGFFILKDGNSVTDESPNSNNCTVAGGTLTKTEDCPSNVFATLNFLYNSGGTVTYSNGNNTFNEGDNQWKTTFSTLGASSGKYYAEFKCGGNYAMIGVADYNVTKSGTADRNFSSTTIISEQGYGIYNGNGDLYYRGSSTSYADTYGNGDIIGVALDCDNNKVFFSKNGTWQNSADPTSSGTGFSMTATNATYVFALAVQTNPTDANFGNGYFGTTAVSSAGTNASNNGIFEYDVPTGYTALSTKGLNL